MISFSIPSEFNLKSVVYSHGWCELPPFEVDKNRFGLYRIFSLSDGRIISGTIRQRRTETASSIQIYTDSDCQLNERKELITQVKTCLRLDEDLVPFYNAAKKHNEFSWIPRFGAGRMLRAPTVFEDLIKMICTTNCSWALTEIMVENLCVKLGDRVGDSKFTFPQPGAIADCTEKYLRKEIRVGYRAPYFLELSKRIARGELNIEQWRDENFTTDELFERALSVKGVGPYAAGNMLRLLGHYDHLALDSWCRKKFYEKHRNGRKVSDKTIEKFYKKFGKWSGLFFWLDVTQHWYDKEFAF